MLERERRMKKREVKGAPSTDLLVCFPTRSHLTLLPKTICSPTQTSNAQNQRHSHHHRRKSIGDGGLWSKKNQIGVDLSEPTSPKVTCAGQIKARPKSGPCKNWQSVMKDLERLHNIKKQRKKHNWGEVLGFKKESLQFLTCLSTFKFDLGCFGAFPNTNLTSDDDDHDDEDDHEEVNDEKKPVGIGCCDQDPDENEEGSSRSGFSKWLMVLEENQDCGLLGKEETVKPKDDQDEVQTPCVPPSNALLLMRCRSTPIKSWSQEKEDDDDNDDEEHDYDNDHDHDGDDDDDEHEDVSKRENLFELMKYEGDFYKLSCDIAKETWVVGGIKKDPLSRTQNSKTCSAKCLQEVKACLQC